MIAFTGDNEYLRLVSPTDTAEVHQLLCLPEVYRYLADGVEPDPCIAENWIMTSADDYGRYGGGLWVLGCSAAPKILGLTRLSDFKDEELQLTYLLHPDLWGRGFATRMAHTRMHHTFNAGVANAIWAGADVANQASVSVMRNLGMRFRRNVDYPSGAGIEYVMTALDFEPGRVEFLSII